MSLKDKVAIVTGGSRGVGRACALALASQGCHVVLAAKTTRPNPRLPGTLHTVAEEIAKLAPSVEALPVKCNLRHPEELAALVETTIAHFGRLDILVNNAGAAWWFPVEKTPPRRFDLVMDLNFKAPHELCRLCIPHLRNSGGGHIVNMSPPVEKAAVVAGKAAYMVSKFGMSYLAIALKEELADDPIAVNALWPVTLIESAATANLGLGEKKDWRKADILADALVAMVSRAPRELGSGRTYLDEEVLTELVGVSDFSSYACVEGATPMVIPW